MLKTYKTLLEGLGYKISELTDDALVAYNLGNHLIISITKNNKVIIVRSTKDDVRFKGVIDNAIQLKLIINCIVKDL